MEWYPWKDARFELSFILCLSKWLNVFREHQLLCQLLIFLMEIQVKFLFKSFNLYIHFWNQIWLLLLMELVQIQSFIKHISIWNLSQASIEILGFTQFYKTKQFLGMPMQAHKRIQISVPLKQSARFDCMNNVTEVRLSLFFPWLFWQISKINHRNMFLY